MKQEQDIATINEQLDVVKYETEDIKNLIYTIGTMLLKIYSILSF